MAGMNDGRVTASAPPCVHGWHVASPPIPDARRLLEAVVLKPAVVSRGSVPRSSGVARVPSGSADERSHTVTGQAEKADRLYDEVGDSRISLTQQKDERLDRHGLDFQTTPNHMQQ